MSPLTKGYSWLNTVAPPLKTPIDFYDQIKWYLPTCHPHLSLSRCDLYLQGGLHLKKKKKNLVNECILSLLNVCIGHKLYEPILWYFYGAFLVLFFPFSSFTYGHKNYLMKKQNKTKKKSAAWMTWEPSKITFNPSSRMPKLFFRWSIPLSRWEQLVFHSHIPATTRNQLQRPLSSQCRFRGFLFN